MNTLSNDISFPPIMIAIMCCLYSRKLHRHHCSLKQTNVSLFVLTLVNRYGHLAKHHPFGTINISQRNEFSFSCQERIISLVIETASGEVRQ